MFENLSPLAVFSLTVLIPGIVQSIKEQFNVQGKAAFIVSVILGFGFVAFGQAMAEGLIPGWLEPWVNIVVYGLAGALAASGYYDLVLKPLRSKLNGS